MHGPSAPPPTFTRRVVTVAAVVLVALALIALVLYASDVLLLAFAGLLLAVFLDGLAEELTERTPLGRRVSLGVVGLGLLGFIVGAGFVVGPQVADQAGAMREAVARGLDAVQAQLETMTWAQPYLDGLQVGGGDVSGIASGALGRITGTLSTLFGVVANAFIIVFVGLYLALHPALYIENGVRLFPASRRARLKEVAHRLGHALRRWLVGQFAAMLIVGTLTTIGLLVLGLPLALVLGLIAFLFSFVPYLGPIAATIPAVLVAFLEGPTMVLWVLGLYLGVQTVESYFLTPMIQKRVVSLPPAILILAQILMGALTGILGVALATPLAVTVIVLVQMLYVEDVIGDDVEVLGEDTDTIPPTAAGGRPVASPPSRE